MPKSARILRLTGSEKYKSRFKLEKVSHDGRLTKKFTYMFHSFQISNLPSNTPDIDR